MAGDWIWTIFQGSPLGKIWPKKWPIFDFLPACSHLKQGQMIFPFKRAFSGPKNRPRNGLSLPTEILAIWADARSNFSLLSFRSWILKFFQGSPLGKMSARCPSDVRQMSTKRRHAGDIGENIRASHRKNAMPADQKMIWILISDLYLGLNWVLKVNICARNGQNWGKRTRWIRIRPSFE